MITICFNNLIKLNIDIESSMLGRNYVNLIRKNYNKSLPVYRDKIKYDSIYLLKLAQQAKDAFGWDWALPEYDLSVIPALHRDLEKLLSKTGFSNVPAKYDNLLHELHYCLHIVQHPDKVHTRIGNLQIEWFNDSGFPLPYDFEFKTELKFGDCLLQNPYVGHGPVQIDNENDWDSIDQTCRFHDFVKPGIVIYTGPNYTIDKQSILNKFNQHNPKFVNKHTEQTILHYTGVPVIGQVRNINDLINIVEYPVAIELTDITFDE